MRVKEPKCQKLKESVIKTLLYYDVFNYPLKADEIFRFLNTNSISLRDVHYVLFELIDENKLYCFDEYYSIQKKEENVIRRKKGNMLADDYKPLVFSRAKLISKFPYVRAVLASGSFSKHYMDEESDIDFFIITAPNRLWIVRMMLALFKRIVFLNSHKTFCCNYFVDTNHLEIEEKNIFTATELATLIPLYGPQHYINIMEKNSWLLQYFPNYKSRSLERVLNHKAGLLKRLFEAILKNKLGDKLDSYFLNLNQKRLRKLYEQKSSAEDFKTSFKSKRSVSKNHPRHHQTKVVELYENKIKSFFEKHHLAEL